MPLPVRAASHSIMSGLLRDLPRWLLAPVPLLLMQPILGRIGTHVAKTRPELFPRLGPHAGKRFLIDPIDLPFALVLVPDASNTQLFACRRHERPRHDARIAGTFINLLNMIGGSLDGDALFFSRDLHIVGDVEAVVALRNALDDCDGNIVDAVVSAFGPLSRPVGMAVSAMRGTRTHHG
jgi:predicted lipid carrier protein YhbT